MKKFLVLNLQLFGEGGADGAGAGSIGTSGTDISGTEEGSKNGQVAAANGQDDLSDVIYGIQTNDAQADAPREEVTKPSKTRSQQFEDLIKGEFKDEFTDRTQKIIDKRFKQSKQMEATLRSHDAILNMLSEKYGTKAGDIEGLTKAIENDESFFEEEAMKQGLTVEQYKELRALQRENEDFRRAKEEAERAAQTDQIYSSWLQQAEELKAKYGLVDFDLATEVENPEFVALLQHPGITLEGAYKAIHFDDMLGGAMAQTAKNVTEKVATSIAQRNSRVSENGISNSQSNNFKTDVNQLTNADLIEIRKRVMRGANISF